MCTEQSYNLLNILFWLKINSCFWPIWINFTFSKYLLNWQTIVKWKNQLNQHTTPSLPPPSLYQSSSSFLPLHVVLPECFNRLFPYQHNEINYSVITREQRWEVCLMRAQGHAESTKERWRKACGREEETRDPLPRPQKIDKRSSCQLTGTPELTSHQRLVNVLLYHSLAKLLDKLPAKYWQGYSNNQLDKVHSLCIATCALWP